MPKHKVGLQSHWEARPESWRVEIVSLIQDLDSSGYELSAGILTLWLTPRSQVQELNDRVQD